MLQTDDIETPWICDMAGEFEREKGIVSRFAPPAQGAQSRLRIGPAPL